MSIFSNGISTALKIAQHHYAKWVDRDGVDMRQFRKDLVKDALMAPKVHKRVADAIRGTITNVMNALAIE
eukprot:48419-Eustigmatos_ZCMA.PRE.1